MYVRSSSLVVGIYVVYSRPKLFNELCLAFQEGLCEVHAEWIL